MPINEISLIYNAELIKARNSNNNNNNNKNKGLYVGILNVPQHIERQLQKCHLKQG
jgi:hypothetical protein